MRIVFGLEPRGGSVGFRFEIVAARDGLAAPPVLEIGVGALRAGVHRGGVDRADEALGEFALGRLAARFDDDLARECRASRGSSGLATTRPSFASRRREIERIPSRPVKRRSIGEAEPLRPPPSAFAVDIRIVELRQIDDPPVVAEIIVAQLRESGRGRGPE